MTTGEIAAFLDRPRVGALATLDRDGSPHLSGMWFLPGADFVRMWTYAKSQKAINARRDPRASLLVEDGLGYSELKGVSLRGSLRLLEGYEDIRAIGIELYRRYSQPRLKIPVEDGPLLEIERQARKRVGLVLQIESVASWDHAKLS